MSKSNLSASVQQLQRPISPINFYSNSGGGGDPTGKTTQHLRNKIHHNYVINRKGERETIRFDKIQDRLDLLANMDPPLFMVNIPFITQKILNSLGQEETGSSSSGHHHKDTITTRKIDSQSAEWCQFYCVPQRIDKNDMAFARRRDSTVIKDDNDTENLYIGGPEYAELASRILIGNLQKETFPNYINVINTLYNNRTITTNLPAPLLSESVYEFLLKHMDAIQETLTKTSNRDFHYNYFAFKTMEKGYLLTARINPLVNPKSKSVTVERPTYMWMRVAAGNFYTFGIDAVLQLYDKLSNNEFIHGTPVLFNSGVPDGQLCSCFLVSMSDDSLDGIYNTLKRCAMISKGAGGIGLNTTCIRATGSYIRGTNGHSNGLVPMLRVYNDTARYVDQGGGKRKGAFAIFLELWHADIEAFLDLKNERGAPETRCKDLFYGLWVADLFMKRVMRNENWSLFCPKEVNGLHLLYGKEFEDQYVKYEQMGRARHVMKAQDLFLKICEVQVETGNPYMQYKDHINRKSNQMNLGTILGSNLCTEIVEFTSPEEVAVCNLASISLPKCISVENGKKYFSFKRLYDITYLATQSCNAVIDRTIYPLPEAEFSNKKHRPTGLGVQGLADTFCILRYPFDSPEARELNKQIFEVMYFAALSASCDLAQKHGKTYESYPGSPISKGLLQFHLWQQAKEEGHGTQGGELSPSLTPIYESWGMSWKKLQERIAQHGVYNSLLIAPMPTASTSQILGNYECTEPVTTNIGLRRTLVGEFTVINQYMVNDLIQMGLYKPSVINEIINNRGSVQSMTIFPPEFKKLYRTVWEIDQKVIIDMAADRSPFIDQSQSLNIHMKDPTAAKIIAMHMYGWKKGLKTGMYYLRTKPPLHAVQVGGGSEVVGTNYLMDLDGEVGEREGVNNGPESDGENSSHNSSSSLSTSSSDDEGTSDPIHNLYHIQNQSREINWDMVDKVVAGQRGNGNGNGNGKRPREDANTTNGHKEDEEEEPVQKKKKIEPEPEPTQEDNPIFGSNGKKLLLFNCHDDEPKDDGVCTSCHG